MNTKEEKLPKEVVIGSILFTSGMALLISAATYELINYKPLIDHNILTPLMIFPIISGIILMLHGAWKFEN